MWSGTDYRTSYTRKKGRATMPGTPQLPEGITPADHVPGPRQGEWTYSHYAALPDDGNRYEILDGVLYMAPSPFGPHQRIAVRLAYYFFLHIEEKGLGIIYPAPFDVILEPNVVVQPDMTVLMHSNIHVSVPSHMKGAPDLVVEILSPSTTRIDRQQKYQTYARTGVKEYWIIDPNAHTIEVFVLEGSVYQPGGVFGGTQIIQSKVIPNFPVQARQLFS
jgi:Uma2 family endonuclease